MCNILELCFIATLLISSSIAFRIDVQFLSDEDRIVGGIEADPGQFPYQVSLRSGNPPRHNCGGSILSNWWIITAGHCILGGPSSLVIVAGAHHVNNDGVVYRVNQTIVHEGYRPSSLENDIAVVQTAQEIAFSETIEPIPLNGEYIGGGVEAIVSGWGRIGANAPLPQYLQFLEVHTLGNEECRSRQLPSLAGYVYNSTLCTFRRLGKRACNGDSGGPLAAGGKLIGLVSWGLPCARGVPDGFTRVSSYIEWISRKTGIIVV